MIRRLIILLLIVGCGIDDYEKTNNDWFDYYNNTDLSIINKLSEIFKRHQQYIEEEVCTNEDQLNYESKTGYKIDGSPGSNFTPRYWSKIIFLPFGRGTIHKGIQQNPFHSIQYTQQFDFKWYLILSPSSYTLGKTWERFSKNKPYSATYDYLIQDFESSVKSIDNKKETKPISFIIGNFTNEEKKEFWSFVDSVKNVFMSNNNYIINRHGNFVEDKNAWNNGKRHGEWTEWFLYSSTIEYLPRAQVNYKDGKIDGKCTWYDINGQIIKEGNYKDGKMDGTLIVWNNRDNKKKKIREGDYKNGKRDGKWTWYWENGQIRIEGNVKDGEGDGKWTSYYENGQISEEENYTDGKRDGKYTRYHENGEIMEKSTWRDGELHGKQVQFEKNGNILVKRNFKDGKIYGKWTEYNYHDNGKISKEINFISAKKGKGIEELDDSVPLDEWQEAVQGSIRDGKSYGYYENGQLMYEQNFINGKKDGKEIVYHQDGNIIQEKIFKDGKLVE